MVKTAALSKLDATDLSRAAGRGGPVAWLGHFRTAPVRLSDQIFLIHGEPSTCAILAGAIRQKLNWHASIPVQSASVEI
jgi:metallo-beta-lactamase family protein